MMLMMTSTSKRNAHLRFSSKMLNPQITQIQPATSAARLAVFLFFFLFIFIVQIVTSIDTPEKEASCLNCIRNVSSSLGVDVTKRCEGYYCGPYQISYTYWAEAGKPGTNQGLRDYGKCARDKSCAEQTVRAYFKKFKRDCNKDGLIDCQDMAALHKGGPASCASDWFYKSRFWLAFNRTSCMSGADQAESPDSTGDKQGNNKFNSLDSSQNLKHPDGLIKNQTLTTECLECICEGATGCNTSTNNCGSGAVCGPFAISQAYWKDGRKPGASWTACARTKECSSVVVKNYMEKYQRDCNDDGYITCEDYAAIHRRGPKACSNRDLLKDNYWNKFLACRANQKPAKDVNMVKVSDDLAHANVLASRGDTNLLIVHPHRDSSSSASSPAGSAAAATTTTPAPSTSTSTTVKPAQASSQPPPPSQLASSTYAHLPSSPSTVEQPFQRRRTTAASFAPSSPSSASSLPVQTTIAAAEGSKFDYAQTPTYELTSVVLNVKDDSQSKGNSDHEPQEAPPQQQLQDARDHYAGETMAPNSDDSEQSGQQSVRPQSPAKLDSEPNVASPGSLAATLAHEQGAPSRATEYELPLVGAQPEQPSGQAHAQTAPTSSTSAAHSSSIDPLETTPIYHSTASTSATIATASSSPSPSPSPPVRQHFAADQMASSLSANENSSSQQGQVAGATGAQQLVVAAAADSRPPLAAMPDELVDYSIGDPAFASQASDAAAAADRANNFDRVVTGIVGSVDFSRSYPPVPDILVGADKQASETHYGQQQQQQQHSSQPDEQQQSLVTKTNHQLTVTTNHSRSPNQQQQQQLAGGRPQPSSSQLQIVESPQRVHTRVVSSPNSIDQQQQAQSHQHESSSAAAAAAAAASTTSTTATATTSKKNSNDSKRPQQQQPSKPLQPSQFSGADSLNMSSLFESGSLNESSKIASECLECICDASSNCDTTVQCISKQREKNRCGLYMISWNQYQDSDISLTSAVPASEGGASSDELADEKQYYECATDRACAEKLIYLYIEKHQRDCNNDGKIDCFDIAAIHRVGPENCNSSKFLASQYWKDFNICYATDRTAAPAHPQPTATTTATASGTSALAQSSSAS